MLDAAVALAARVVLAGTLVGSAVAKLRSGPEVRRQIGAITSDRLGALSAALPGVELVVAVALVVFWSPIPGIVALVLLAVFTGALIRAQARHVPCACFGAGESDAPPGPWSIVRNGVLAALAALAIGDPSGASAGATIGFTLLFGAIAALAVRAGTQPGADPEARSSH